MNESSKGKLILVFEAKLLLDPQNEPLGSNFASASVCGFLSLAT